MTLIARRPFRPIALLLATAATATAVACAAPGGAPLPSASPPDLGRCGAPATPAWSIQGDGAETPMEGRDVVVEGVVVGDYEGPAPALRGFYLQDLEGDDDPSTSDAVFIFNGDRDDVRVGDRVRVAGEVAEFEGQTQVERSGPPETSLDGSLEICGRGHTVAPVEVTLPFPSADWPERLEGMLVRLPAPLHVTDHYQLGRFGTVTLSSGGRLPQPTQVAEPGPAARAVQEANDLNRIVVDDHRNDQNPDPIPFGRGGEPLTAENTLRGGDQVTGLTGVMTWGWGGDRASGNAWRIRPIGALGGGSPMFVPANPRPAPPPVGGSTRIGVFNVLNYFNTFSACTAGRTGGEVDCRGADDAAQFERQWRKIVATIAAMDADVLGVVEIENDGYGPGSAIAHLADRAAEATGAPWTFVKVDSATGTVDALGSDAIKVGLLYRQDRVRPVGATAVLATPEFVTGGDPAPRNRPALAQAFETFASEGSASEGAAGEGATGEAAGGRVVVAINHLKSKGSRCQTPDAGDGQGNCNEVRATAARELASWLATDPTGTGDPDVLILGDLNAYAMEDPVRALTSAGYEDLLAAPDGTGAYTYVFGGQWGRLDHALASPSLVPQVTGVAAWPINADEPPVLGYPTAFKSDSQRTTLYSSDPYRSSDHDPLVVGLELRPE